MDKDAEEKKPMMEDMEEEKKPLGLGGFGGGEDSDDEYRSVEREE